MNDLSPNGDDSSGNNNSPPNHNKTPDTGTEILLGMGLAAICYTLCIRISYTSLSNTMQGLAVLAILLVVAIGNVKLFKSQHRTAAIALLIATSPLYLGALLLGTCSVLF
ncbi:MAG: hypothetical protein CVU90_02920 [Firmicutes bacterium HGW-Firmicutes-15]|nr:MAG: hypothetical protein CVU90_02920 [Firmicutes bacterium HGW-Firmicutes-15]